MNIRTAPINTALAIQQPENFGRAIAQLTARDPHSLWILVLSLDQAVASDVAQRLGAASDLAPNRWVKAKRTAVWA